MTKGTLRVYLICGWLMIVLGILTAGMMIFPVIKGRPLTFNPLALGGTIFGGVACLYRYNKEKN